MGVAVALLRAPMRPPPARAGRRRRARCARERAPGRRGCAPRGGRGRPVAARWSRSRRESRHPRDRTVSVMDRKWWTLIAVCTATFMLLLDVTIVNVALPAIERDLGVDLQRPAVGGRRLRAHARRAAADRRLARRPARPPARLRRSASSLFTVASVLCGARHTPLRSTSRAALQGVGGAIMFATSLALLAAAFQGARARDRVRHLGRDHRRRGRRRPARRRRAHRAASAGSRSSSSTCRSASVAIALTLRTSSESRDPHAGAARLARARHVLGRAVPAHLRADPRQRRGLGQRR